MVNAIHIASTLTANAFLIREAFQREQSWFSCFLLVLCIFSLCIDRAHAQDSESQLTSSPDSATWTGVITSTYISLGTAAIFMFVFEFGRRNKAVAAVFDRRRQTNVHRTPPPLIKSRLCEWLFLRTDPAYLHYAEKAAEKETERKKQFESQRKLSVLRRIPMILRITNIWAKGGDAEACGKEDPTTRPKPNGNNDASGFTISTDISTSTESRVRHISSRDPDSKKALSRVRFASQKTVSTCSSNSNSNICAIRNRATETDEEHNANTGNETISEESSRESSSDSSSSSSHFVDTDDENSQHSELMNQLESGKRSEDDCTTMMCNIKKQSTLSPFVTVNNFKIPREMVHYAIDIPLEELEQLEKKSMAHARRRRRQYEDPEPFELDPSNLNHQISGSRDAKKTVPVKRLRKESSCGSKSIDKRRRRSGSVGNSLLLECTQNIHYKRPLKVSDQELLRCVGLDLFVSLRFLRFCFQICFCAFLVATVVLIPTYYTNDFDGTTTINGKTTTVATNGYFQFTMQRLQSGNNKLWISFVFSILFYFGILRRLWVEWETYIPLRYDFLANGDSEAKTEQDHVEQYRCSCMVEYVPESLRGDKELFDFFNALFPGQVERAEILLNASKLTELIEEREKNIKLYEDVYAKHSHQKSKYSKQMEVYGRQQRNLSILQYFLCSCTGMPPKKPMEPLITLGRDWKNHGRRKQVEALPYYLLEIKRLNRLIEVEHKRILQEKLNRDRSEVTQKFDVINFTAGAMAHISGVVTSSDLNCDTGFVQFKNLTSKQSAIQCNITGTSNFLVTSPAPDRRDIIWRNAIVERGGIFLKQKLIYGLLLTGMLFWSFIITGINTISNIDTLDRVLPSWMIPKPGSFWAGLIQGWLPVVLLEIVMKILISILNLVSKRYIRYKTRAECDNFVYKWNFAYRLANILIIILSGSLLTLLKSSATNPQEVLQSFTEGLLSQSQFFLNNVIVSIGTETLMELAQIRAMIVYFVMYKFITVEAKSQRYLEKLEEADKFEWGEDVPNFFFVFMVAIIYAAQVPIILGACAFYFYISLKVYKHQCLFVYSQPYEGGGKLMKLLNRTILTSLYVGIGIFSTTLALKSMKAASPAFLVIMSTLTFYVDFKIHKTFVAPSETLALIQAREIDEKDRKKKFRVQRPSKKKMLVKNVSEEASTGFEAANTNSSEGDACSNAQSIVKSEQTLHEKPSNEVWDRLKRSQLMDRLRRAISAKFLGGNNENDDFFIYRQPHLNKSIWETEPRPYR